MSIIDTIVSDIGSVVSDPGKLVTDVVDAVLPGRLKAVGDLAGGVADLVLGKESQAVSHFKDGLKDLPQLASGTSSSTPPDEPAPPPARSTAAADASDPTSVASLLALPSDQFMNAVTSGAVPAEVASDPAAMLQIQARVNDIAQMNQLITSMMSATHQMQMSIAQNIRA